MYDIVCIKKVINITLSTVCERVNESPKPGRSTVTQRYKVRASCAAEGRSRAEKSSWTHGVSPWDAPQHSAVPALGAAAVSLPGTAVAQKLSCSSASFEGPMTAVLRSVVFSTFRGGRPGDSAANCHCRGSGGRGGTASKFLDVRTSRGSGPYKTRAGICKPNARFGRERGTADCTTPQNKNGVPGRAEGQSLTR